MGGLFGDGTLGAEGGHGDVRASQAGVGRVRATVPSIASLPKKMNHTTHESLSKTRSENAFNFGMVMKIPAALRRK